MSRNATCVVIALSCPLFAAAAIPPGYEVIQVTHGENFDHWPRINDSGQFVFSSWTNHYADTSEIFLYENGTLTQISTGKYMDDTPAINDAGTIVWTYAKAKSVWQESTWEIAVWRDGMVDVFTDNDVGDSAPTINNHGYVTWIRTQLDQDCWGFDIMAYDGTQIYQLNDDEFANQNPEINDSGQIVWERDFNCQDPWESNIILLDNGQEYNLSGDQQHQPELPVINNIGTIAWVYLAKRDDGGYDRPIAIWRDGEQHRLTDDGINPRLNDHDDVYFVRWDVSLNAWQAWIHLRGEFYQLTNDEVGATQGDINNRTDIVIKQGQFPVGHILLLKRLPFGDMNCDKQVDFDDIDGFVAALVGKDAFQKVQPDCDWWLADMNDDRSVDFLDIDPFVTCLINNGCP